MLFDLDGVVFDTEGQYTRFWGTQARIYHPEIPDLEHIIKGQTLQQIFDRYFDDVKDEQPKIVDRLNRFEQDMDFTFLPGFVDFINDLHAHGVKTAVVTSSSLSAPGRKKRVRFACPSQSTSTTRCL